MIPTKESEQPSKPKEIRQCSVGYPAACSLKTQHCDCLNCGIIELSMHYID